MLGVYLGYVSGVELRVHPIKTKGIVGVSPLVAPHEVYKPCRLEPIFLAYVLAFR